MKKKFSSALVAVLVFLFVIVLAFCGVAVAEELESTTASEITQATEPSQEEVTENLPADEKETTTETPVICPEGEHKFTTEATKATLENDGYEKTYCEVCGYVRNEGIIYRITDIVLFDRGEPVKNNEIVYDGYYHQVFARMYDSAGETHYDSYFLNTEGNKAVNEIGTYKVTVSYQSYQYDITEEITYKVVPPYVPQPAFTSAKSAKSGVQLTWDKVKGVEGYEVYRKTSSTDWKKLETLTDTKYTDKSAVYNVEYIYAIKAYKTVYYTPFYSAGEEKKVKTKYVITPDAPTLEVTNYGVRVSWTSVAGATKYYIYRSATKSGGYSKIGETKASKIKFGDKKATLGKTYYYKVKAYTGNKAGTASSATGIKATLIAPTIKKNITATSKAFTFSWNKLSEADGYFIYKLDGKKYTKVAEIKDKNTTKYTYKSTKLVRLVLTSYFKDSKGKKIESPYSKTIFANAIAKPTIELVASADEKVIFVNSGCKTNSYQIYYKVGKSGEWKLLEKGNSAFSAHNTISAIHSVKLNKNYYYKMRAVEIKADNVIYGEYSDVKQLTFGYIPGVTVSLPNKNYERGQSFQVTIKNGTKKALKINRDGYIRNTDLASSGDIFIWGNTDSLAAGKSAKITFSVNQVPSPILDTKMPAYQKTSKIVLYFNYGGVNYASVYNVKTGNVFK